MSRALTAAGDGAASAVVCRRRRIFVVAIFSTVYCMSYVMIYSNSLQASLASATTTGGNYKNNISSSVGDDTSFSAAALFTNTTGWQQQRPPTETVHILFALSGNNIGFISEFEVALKSVLMNGGNDYRLHVHDLAMAMRTVPWIRFYYPRQWNTNLLVRRSTPSRVQPD
jgi:hypothetical protein